MKIKHPYSTIFPRLKKVPNLVSNVFRNDSSTWIYSQKITLYVNVSNNLEVRQNLYWTWYILNSARKYISIQFLYSFFIAFKWFFDKLLGGFTSTGTEMKFILFLPIDRCFRFPSLTEHEKSPSKTKSGKLEKKHINFNSL